MKIGESVVGVHPPTRATVLTYDDGPTPGVTDAILATLAEAGARATFFVLLSRTRRTPELLREILAGGHEVGLHGADHRRLPDLDPGSLPALLRDARSELEDAAGVPVRWFRPPYGAQSAASWRAALDAGMTPAMWSRTCRDWLTLDPDAYLAEVRGGTLRGEVVLLHDGYAGAGDGVDDGPVPDLDRVALTRGVLAEVARQRLRAVTLGEAVAPGRPRMEVRLTGESRLDRLRRRISPTSGGTA
jgi:peptidoglycan/xylan/chitin deacetylase (PgdA/CDA1 family)